MRQYNVIYEGKPCTYKDKYKLGENLYQVGNKRARYFLSLSAWRLASANKLRVEVRE